jgi:hypothetical protein
MAIVKVSRPLYGSVKEDSKPPVTVADEAGEHVVRLKYRELTPDLIMRLRNIPKLYVHAEWVDGKWVFGEIVEHRNW